MSDSLEIPPAGQVLAAVDAMRVPYGADILIRVRTLRGMCEHQALEYALLEVADELRLLGIDPSHVLRDGEPGEGEPA